MNNATSNIIIQRIESLINLFAGESDHIPKWEDYIIFLRFLNLFVSEEKEDGSDIHIDALRRRIYEFEQDIMEPVLRTGGRTVELAHINECLFQLYNDLIEAYKPEKSFIYNLWDYRQVLKEEREFGYPILGREHKPVRSLVPEREKHFTGREKQVKLALDFLTADARATLCISGKESGDENAGVGKTVLAREICNLIIADHKQLESIRYISTTKGLSSSINNAKRRFYDGVIWVSIQSYKKDTDSYLHLITEALGEKFEFKSRTPDAGKPTANQTSQDIFGEVLQSEAKALQLTEEEIAVRERDRRYRAHHRIDCIEKVALLLSRRDVLLVLDNAEQDRSTFDFLFSHLRGFVPILVTCRVRLAGVPTHLLEPFTPDEARRYFYALKPDVPVVPEDNTVLSRLLKRVGHNPYCISLLRHNLKGSLEQADKAISARLLKESVPSTVRVIVAILDATKALTEAEKSLLFDASIFFKEHFSAFQLSCYDPFGKETDIQQQLQLFYDDKKVVSLYTEHSDEKSHYAIHQSVKQYLREWFETKMEIAGLAEAERINALEETLRSRSKNVIDEFKSKAKRLHGYFENIRILNYLKKPEQDRYEWQEEYWAEIVFEFMDETNFNKSDYFQNHALENYIKHKVYFEYTSIRLKNAGKRYTQGNWDAGSLLRQSLLKNEIHRFQGGIHQELSSIYNNNSLTLCKDFTTSGFVNKYQYYKNEHKNNILVSIHDHIVMLLPWESKRDLLKQSILQSIIYADGVFDWKFKFTARLFEFYLHHDIALSGEYLNQIQAMGPVYYDKAAAREIAQYEADYYLKTLRFAEALERAHKMPTENVDKFTKVASALIGLKEFEKAEDYVSKILNQSKPDYSIHPHIAVLYLRALMAFQQENYIVAARLIEQLVINKNRLDSPVNGFETALKDNIVSALGGIEPYNKVIDVNSIQPDVELPDFVKLPDECFDIDGKRMVRIPQGRTFYENKLKILPDSEFILERSTFFLETKEIPGVDFFSREMMVYDFYVDAEPVTKEEFDRFFREEAPIGSRQQQPEFTAENVTIYAQNKGKVPVTFIELSKLFHGVNYNQYSLEKALNPDYDVEKDSIWKETANKTVLKSNSLTDIYNWAYGLKGYNPDARFSPEFSCDIDLLMLIAYAPALDSITRKRKVLEQLNNTTNEKLIQLYDVLRANILSHVDSYAAEDPFFLELLFNSQKNVWKIALKYYFGLEKSFKIIHEEATSEAAVIEKNGTLEMVELTFKDDIWEYKQAVSKERFIPFRCIKMGYELITSEK